MKFAYCVTAAGLAALVSACTTPAATGTVAAASAEPQKVAANGEPLICRSMKVTGTRFAKRECKTADAWVQYDAYTNGNAKESADKFQRLNTGSATQTN